MTGKDGSKRQQHPKVPKHHILVEHRLVPKTGFLPRQVTNSVVSPRLEHISPLAKFNCPTYNTALKQKHSNFKLGKKRRKQDQKFPNQYLGTISVPFPSDLLMLMSHFLKYFAWVKNDFPKTLFHQAFLRLTSDSNEKGKPHRFLKITFLCL